MPKTEELVRKAVFYDEIEQHVSPRGSIWVPPPCMTEVKVLSLLTKQNKWLNTTGWVVRRRVLKEAGGDYGNRPGEKFFLMMNKESIPALEQKDFVVQFGLAKAVIYMEKSRPDEEGEDRNHIISRRSRYRVPPQIF